MSASDTNQTYLPYLPPEYRDAVDFNLAELAAIFRVSREAIRLRGKRGQIPAPMPGSSKKRPRWSAAGLNAFLAAQANQQN